MTRPAAGIFGVAGASFSEEEKRFFAVLNPVGFILFAHNCESPAQIKQLVLSMKELLQREDVLILIDQEGGRVARLKPPHWRKSPAAGAFATLAQTSLEQAKKATYANARLVARELNELGINVDCAPLADVPVAGSHNIIGDRAYGDTPDQVSALAREMAQGLTDGGVLPVLKHIPGHGRAQADSHMELPVVETSLDVLEKSDFIPFKHLCDLPLGMTAHILYTSIDAKRPATLSAKVISMVRKHLMFDGLLMSDDISMKALKDDYTQLAHDTLQAGCDLVLHCNGKMHEMRAIAEGLRLLDDAGERRFKKALLQLQSPKAFDYQAAAAQLEQWGIA